MLRFIDTLGRDEIDLVAFTSASQASNLFTVAQCDGKEASLKQSLGRAHGMSAERPSGAAKSINDQGVTL